MSDGVDLTNPAGVAAADEVTDATLGLVKVQYVKFMDGTLDSTNKAIVDSNGAFRTTQGSLVSAGAQQNNLSIINNTQLTVPAGARFAFMTLEGADIRRTSDGTSASTSAGSLIKAGAQWMDAGPLAAYKFTAVSGSPTLTVEYFK